MKKLLSILLIAVLISTIAGCSETSIEPVRSEEATTTAKTTPLKTTKKVKTTEKQKTTETQKQTDEPKTTEEEICASFAPESFSTIEELQAFIKNDRELRGKEILVPKVGLDGFELEEVTHSDSGMIGMGYKMKNYVRDNRFSEADNEILPLAYYAVRSFDKNDKVWLKETIERFYELGYKLIKIDGREVYYLEWRSENGKAIIRYTFSYFEGDKDIIIALPAPAVEGLSVQEMGRYLEMVKVES